MINREAYRKMFTYAFRKLGKAFRNLGRTLRPLLPELLILVVGALIALLALVASGYGGELEEAKRLAPKYGTPEDGIEWRTWDGSRIDLLPDAESEYGEYALEVEYASKWKEAPGQATLYAIYTKRKPGVVLLVKSRTSEARYIYRCLLVCERIGVRVWLEEVETE